MRMFIPAAVILCLSVLEAQAASRGHSSNPRPHHPATRRPATHAAHHTSRPPVHHTAAKAHKRPVTHTATRRQNTAHTKSRVAHPARSTHRTAFVPAARHNSSAYARNRTANLRTYSSYPHNYRRYRGYYARRGYYPYRSVNHGYWVHGVVVATRYGTGLRSGSFTIRVWRPSYARLGGMINGRIAYVGNRFAPAGPYNLRAFQTVQYTRFLPGQASLASLRRGEAVAVLPMSNNLRVARAVQMSFRQNLALAPRVQ